MPDELHRFRRFRLEVNGVALGAFHTLGFPGFASEVVETPEGKRPGATRRTPALLASGVADGRSLLAWFDRALAGDPDRRAGAVVELGPDGEPTWRHEFTGAWPVRVALGRLTLDSLHAVEAFEFAVDSWTARREDPPRPLLP